MPSSHDASYLVLRVAGELMRFGNIGRTLRGTAPSPTKGAVVGIICNAMGCSRHDDHTPVEVASLKMHAFEVGRYPISVMVDFQTVGVGGEEPLTVKSYEDDNIKTPLTSRKTMMDCLQGKAWAPKCTKQLAYRKAYLQDADFVVILEGRSNLVFKCSQALLDPMHILYIGSHCCLPSVPIWDGVFEDEQSALNRVVAVARENGRSSVSVVQEVVLPSEANDSIDDQPTGRLAVPGNYRRRLVRRFVWEIQA